MFFRLSVALEAASHLNTASCEKTFHMKESRKTDAKFLLLSISCLSNCFPKEEKEAGGIRGSRQTNAGNEAESSGNRLFSQQTFGFRGKGGESGCWIKPSNTNKAASHKRSEAGTAAHQCEWQSLILRQLCMNSTLTLGFLFPLTLQIKENVFFFF